VSNRFPSCIYASCCIPDGLTETLRLTSKFRGLNEPGTCLDPSTHTDAAGGRRYWNCLFFVIYYQPAPYLGVHSRQSTGASNCGYQSLEDNLLLFRPAAIRRHRLPVVHRGGARPFRGREDLFFATVFLGSGLLFIAMVFGAAAAAGGIISVLGSGSESLINSGAYALGRAEIAQTMHIYAMKMAGVFMITTSTISLRTRVFPHWMAVLGYGLVIVLLLSVGTIEWIPLWVLLISAYILTENLRPQSDSPA
jgi:hypothetical protein